MIWTTTPWTIPGNRALAYGPDIAYALVEVAAVGRGQPGAGRREDGAGQAIWSAPSPKRPSSRPRSWRDVAADDLEGLIAAHPLRGQGYEFDVRLLPGDFVTADAGTGFVHIAPGHGADDYELGVANGVEVPDTVAEDGSYYPHVPLFAGLQGLHGRRQEGRRQPRRDRGARQGGQAAGLGPHHATPIRIPGAPRRR